MAKLKIVIPLLLVLGGVYKFVLAKPAPVAAKPKIEGVVYILPKDFLVNLKGGRFAKLSVGMVFKEGYTGIAEEGGEEGSAAKVPEGYGTLAQEAVVRAIITDALTDQTPEHLTERESREKIQKRIVKKINKTTDVKVEEMLFTDLAVQ